MTTLEKIYKELAERFKDEPNKNMILGYTMGVLERNKAALVEEQVKNLRKAFVSGELPLTEVAKCGKCDMLGDAAPCDECYRNGNYR
jgi:hypothetical protein